MQAITIRLFAAIRRGEPALPSAEDETKYGKPSAPTAAPVALVKNPRRDIVFLPIFSSWLSFNYFLLNSTVLHF
jgi:hypothetical protein